MRTRSHIADPAEDIIQSIRRLSQATVGTILMTQAPANRSTHPLQDIREPRRSAIQPLTITISLTLMLVALWALTHRYQGFARDGELYAVQAMAKIHTNLNADLYLENNSQDRYTIFSRIYASFINSFGLQNAELLLFVVCTAWFLAAAWTLARELSNADTAWLAVAMLVTTVGYYGAYAIFHYSESYLTARSMAEALVVTSLVAHFRGWRHLGLGTAVGALFIHPLMALPGVLLLICLWLPVRQAILGAAAGVLATLGIALTAVTGHFLTIIDAPWLEVVTERSQFLFLNYWKGNDWELHARPFLCLTLSALVIGDERIKRLCIGAALVGAAGLAVAFIAGALGPVAILLQGQAWRWFWVTGFVSVLLLAPTALRLWHDAKCGPICATLIISGWTFAPVDGTAVIALALFLWSLRSRIDSSTARQLRWAGFILIAVVVVWILANSWSLVTSPPVESGRETLMINRLRSVSGLQLSVVLFFGLFWYWIRSIRTVWGPALVAVFLTVASLLILPGSFKQIGTVGSRSEIEEFADWRNAIPPTSNVLIVPTRKSASFAWFTLGRPSYLSVDQSSGVVFSRATAFEVRRRSEVLLPIADPDWKILSQITQESHGKKLENLTRPLTSKSLAEICGDSKLGFVIAKERLGFDSIQHTHVGAWKDWNLYDCRRVRSSAPAA